MHLTIMQQIINLKLVILACKIENNKCASTLEDQQLGKEDTV